MHRFRLVLAFTAAALAASAQQYTITTVAGTGGTAGYAGDGAPASAAQLSKPNVVARDGKGNLFISDLGNYVIRKIDTNGNISTFAGNNSFGFSGDGGPATSAQISTVNGIAVDAKGDVYLADTSNGRVRIVTPDGNIATFAGNGTHGYAGDGAAAASATLYYPSGVAVDAQNNVYIADYGAGVVRKVNAAGIISTFAGNGGGIFGTVLGDGGPAASAVLNMPFSVAVDAAGNVYIGDLGSSSIRRVTTNGIIGTIASNLQAASFALDNSGAIYYSNYDNSTVVKIYPTGTQLWIAGDGQAGYSGDGGPGISAQLNAPYGLAVDGAGNIFVADSKNDVIRELTPAGNSIASVANSATNIGFSSVASGSSGTGVPPIAPGEIVTLFGAGLGPANLTVNTPHNGVYGSTLAGVSVTFNGTSAPIIYVSATQTAVQAPYELDGASTAFVSLTYNGQSALGITVPVAATSPGIFTFNATGSGQAAVVNADGTINSAAHPAPIGGYVSLYLTGEGTISPQVVDGSISPANASVPNAGVAVTIGGQPASTTYIGEAPDEVVGLLQINAQIPSNITPGTAVPVVVSIGGVNTQRNVTIAVSAQ